MYSVEVIRYFHQSRHIHSWTESEKQVITVTSGGADQIHHIQLQLKVKEAKKVEAVCYKLKADPITMAVMAYVCEHIEGRTFTQIKQIGLSQVMRALNLASCDKAAVVNVLSLLERGLEYDCINTQNV